MEFRILGPLEVLEDGLTLDLGALKQRALLAVLLLSANRVVSSDRLISALWEDQPPETAQKALQVYVSQLRKVLGKERLETRAPGYLLRVEDGELDLDRFTRLSEEGKPEEALRLWRGPPLSDFAYQRFAHTEIARLEELRIGCLEERIERDLAQGRWAELTGELEALVSEHPLRERLRAQLMLALYRSGRQAEALEAYQQARTALVEELGIEPSRQLRELHQAILNQDPALDLTGRAASAELARGTFVGREEELGALLECLDDALAGQGRIVLLVGEPGIGKSRLAEELVAHARARGARVLVGRCWEAGGAPAYWPWVQSLRAYVKDAEPAAVRSQLGAGGGDVAQIVPELLELFPDLPNAQPAESEAARFRMFDSLSSFLLQAAAERPIVLVLDDLHAADEPSLLLLSYLASVLGAGRILAAGTLRDVDPTMSVALQSTLAELAREPVTQRIRLSGLSESEVGRLAEVTAGAPPPESLVAELYAETEGNPLFVSEIVRLLAAEGRLEAPGGEGVPIPASVREAIERRLRRLSGECRRVLSLASVLGREFGLVALERVADYTGIDKLLSVLDEAIAAKVVEEVPGALGRLRFGHALIRDTLYSEIPATHRIRLHRRVAEVLEALYATNMDPHLAEVAYHFSLAAPAAGPEKAIEYSRRAGDRAAGLFAYEEAARLYELALSLAEAEDSVRCDLLLALGDVQARAGDSPASKQTYRDAAELAEHLGLPEQLAGAALGYGGRLVWGVSRDDEYLTPLLERALRLLPEQDSALRARVLSRLAGGPLRDASFPPERKAELAQEALAMARRIGDPATLAYALEGYIAGHHSPEFVPQQLDLATELIEVSMEVGDNERAVEGHEVRLMSLLELGEPGAEAESEAMTKRAEELRQPAQQWLAAVNEALLALLEGRFDEAESLISNARTLGERALAWSAAVSFALQMYVLRWSQGRLGEVEELIRRMVAENPTYPICGCALAHVQAELDQRAEGSKTLDALAADGFSGVPFDEEWLVSLSLLAEAVRSLGDAARAAVLYDLLLPYADRVAVSYPEISTGSVSRYLGFLAAMLTRWKDAEHHFDAAVEMNERMGARPWLAHSQEDYGRMLLERGEIDRGAELIAAALAGYRELGMDTYAARAQTLVAT
jgi:DNA-binding SARP family transcriptional activator